MSHSGNTNHNHAEIPLCISQDKIQGQHKIPEGSQQAGHLITDRDVTHILPIWPSHCAPRHLFQRNQTLGPRKNLLTWRLMVRVTKSGNNHDVAVEEKGQTVPLPYDSALNRSKLLIHARTWIHLKGIMWGAHSQPERSHFVWSLLHKLSQWHGVGKSRLAVAWSHG